ncbi:serine/threonine-protein phosphatase 6 regulatory ankyrin repeat subunit C-like [Cyanistes caeruleus]|uniref:serine/threonine-protein phosphatase 6 regulatory ankyrin repeat subunit C-like n=1 Tax=Cyanistes caeruleus TaxID=156563 RepID=UPI000CDAE111|nr:serine/threonine-protein phosphatase 6 regulatory ankyrin repeat subunit C-like [Cyanistes caeruleus]
MVNLLLNKGASPSTCDKKDRQPLHWAAFLGHLEVLKLLVARGADVACKDRKGYTLLHTAAASGQIEVVRHLLRLGVEIDEPNSFGNTALHIACYMGQDAVANELVNVGANVNQPNDKGFTPLHFAAVSTNGALCLEILVNNGADVNFQSKEGKSPLHMAAIHGRFTRSQILIQNGPCVPALSRVFLEAQGGLGAFPNHPKLPRGSSGLVHPGNFRELKFQPQPERQNSCQNLQDSNIFPNIPIKSSNIPVFFPVFLPDPPRFQCFS